MTFQPPPLPYDSTYYKGDYSYWENCKRMAGGDWDGLFPVGWGQPGETPEGTTYRNAVEALWLPLFLNADCDGYRADGNPSACMYAAQVVATIMDQQIGPAHSSEEVDAARWTRACELALEACTSTSGSTYVRE